MEIDIPAEFLIHDFDNPIQAIFQSTYTNFLNYYNDPQYFQSRAILASTIKCFEEINDYILSLIPGNYSNEYITLFMYLHQKNKHDSNPFLLYCIGEEQEYLSFDEIDRSEINDECQSFDILTP